MLQSRLRDLLAGQSLSQSADSVRKETERSSNIFHRNVSRNAHYTSTRQQTLEFPQSGRILKPNDCATVPYS